MPARTPWRSSARWNALLSLLLFAAILPACHQDKTVAPGYHEYAYVSNGKSNSVSVIDLLQLRNVKTIPVGAGPTGIAASLTRNEIYVANADSNNVSIIDAERNQVIATLAFMPSRIMFRFRPMANGPTSPIPVRQMFP